MAAKIKNVLYHSPNAKSKAFLVLKEHKDGTVDIGNPDGTVVVRACQIKDVPSHGHATAYTPPDDATAAAQTAADKIEAELKLKTRDELLAKVVDYNTAAPADAKIVISPTVGQTELVEKLLAVLTPNE